SEHDENDPVRGKIERLQAIERAGAEILLLRADVADEEQMRRAIEKTCERFGEINGVIHAAGVASAMTLKPIQETTQVECEAHFRPKLLGLLVLEKVLKGRDLDFCVLFSSLSSILGGL